jgi:CubicO group peptidase (beta-lactamase class C family)
MTSPGDLDLTHVPGFAGFSGVVLVKTSTGSSYAAAAGLAHRAWRIPNTLDTRFRIGSISKMFTAVAALHLIEQGRFTLGDPIASLLDVGTTTLSERVTVEHLLSMTSGIADWFDESGDWAANWAELLRTHPIYLLREDADYLPLFAHKPAVNAPGDRYRYNGAGYILLGLLIARVSGMTVDEYLQRHVFAPAGMTSTGFIAIDDAEAQVAEGYLGPAGSGAMKNVYSVTPRGAADGGATSTAGDLIAFLRAVRTSVLLSTDMTAQMLRPRVPQGGGPVRGYELWYGYGIMSIVDNAEQVVRWGHTGEEDGVSARLYHYPELDTDVVILSNQSWSSGDLAWQIHDRLLGKNNP